MILSSNIFFDDDNNTDDDVDDDIVWILRLFGVFCYLLLVYYKTKGFVFLLYFYILYAFLTEVNFKDFLVYIDT